MQYRSFPNAPSLRISALGLGSVRLPAAPGDPGRIDEEAATTLVHRAVEAGVSYVDTAFGHHGGAGEPLVGRALRGGWRDRVQLATKAPLSLVKEEADWDRILDAQLERLGTDRIDFYLLPLSEARWQAVQRLGGLRALDRARADRRIARLGFSFDGALATLEHVLAGHEWDCCELELNFLDADRQLGSEALRRAARRGVGVIVAEPLRGGALAHPPPIVQDVWARSGRPWSPAEWALRWVWNHAEVITAVCAATSLGDLEEYVRAAEAAAPLGPEELQRVDEARRIHRSRRRVPCETCGSCEPCPGGVAIGHALSLFNDAMFVSKADPVADYRRLVEQGQGADRCTACGACELKCPKQIPIVEELRAADAYLART
jgi:predicted aldo/keto reductase-like oxidoreductase